MPPTIINRHADAAWEERPAFFIETRSPITEKLQLRHPSQNRTRFRYRIGDLREVWDHEQRRNKWVFPLSEGEVIDPEDDETYIVVAGSEIRQDELKAVVQHMREKAAKRRAVRNERRPSPREVSDALRNLAELRLQAAQGRTVFGLRRPPVKLDRIPANQVAAMAEVARSGMGL